MSYGTTGHKTRTGSGLLLISGSGTLPTLGSGIFPTFVRVFSPHQVALPGRSGLGRALADGWNRSFFD